MERNLNLKLNNNLTNVKNKFSSIFSRLFNRKKIQNEKNIVKDEVITINNSNKSAKTNKNNVEFVDINKNNREFQNNNHERGVIPPFIIKIIIGIVVTVVIAVALFTAFYSLVSNASLTFNVEAIAGTIKEFLVMIVYEVAKWILCVVDIIFSYVKSLCGLNMDFTSLSGIFSAQSDIVFNLFITAEKRATQIFRNLIALAIILIIVFTIIALIKTQLTAMRSGKPTSVMDTIKKTIRAFVLLLITPFLAIGGIVFSDLLLQTLFRATNTTNSSTLGTQIFATAAVSSNAYRNYAMGNQRIPISCDFTREKEILEYYENNSPSETFTEYLESSNNLIYVTYMSFINDDFIKFSDINDILVPTNSEAREKSYYGIYDIKPGGSKYQRINTYAEEYYVMADVIDFDVNTGNMLYIVNIENLLDIICEIPDEILSEKIFNSLVQKYELRFFVDEALKNEVRGNGEFISWQNYKAKSSWNYLAYTSYYISPNDNGTPENPMQILYVHIKGAKDELEGAKYIVAYQNSFDNNGVSYNYFEPMTNGYNNRYDISFDSEYIEDGQIIAAKGDFKDGIYPTAIKETTRENGTQITFYREDLEAVAVGAMNEVFKANLNDDGDSNWFTNFIKMIQLFFQPESIIGEITYNPEVIQSSYSTKGIAVVNNLVNGRIRLGYFLKFKPELPDRFAAGRTISLKEIFDPQRFNLVLILVAPLILCRVGMIALFGLIQRAFELFLIILTYPAACATIPYEERAYGKWWNEYFQRLFATYGVILAINFVLALFPIISSLEYFTAAEIATNKVLYKVTHLFFGFLTINQITRLLNTLIVILFELVAFTLLDSENGIPKIINNMLGVSGLNGGFVETVKKMITRVKKAVKATVKVVKLVAKVAASSISMALETLLKPEQARKRLAKHKKFIAKLVPGSKLLDAAQKSGSGRATKKAMNKFWSENADVDAKEPGEKPKPPDRKDFPDDEEGDKKFDEAQKKYEDDLSEWKKNKENADKAKLKPMQDVIDAQENELSILKGNGPKQKKQEETNENSENSSNSKDEKNDKHSKIDDENKKEEDKENSELDSEPKPEDVADSSEKEKLEADKENERQNAHEENNNKDNDEKEDEQEQEKENENHFDADAYGMRGLDDEMSGTDKKYRDEQRKQYALEDQLKKQRKSGDLEAVKRTEELLKQCKERQKALEDHYYEVFAAKQDRLKEEKRIKEHGTDEEKRQLEMKNKMREANDDKLFADKKANGETIGGRIKEFIVLSARDIGDSIRQKAIDAWQSHLERRRAKWAKKYANIHGNIFKQVRGHFYRKHIDKKVGRRAKTYEKDKKKLEDLNRKYNNGKDLDKNSKEYRDYINQKERIERRMENFEEDFNTLFNIKENISKQKSIKKKVKANKKARIMNKILGDSEKNGKHRAVNIFNPKHLFLHPFITLGNVINPLRLVRANISHKIASGKAEVTREKTEVLEEKIQKLEEEYKALESITNKNDYKKKIRISHELEKLKPQLEALKSMDQKLTKWNGESLNSKRRHAENNSVNNLHKLGKNVKIFFRGENNNIPVVDTAKYIANSLKKLPKKENSEKEDK